MLPSKKEISAIIKKVKTGKNFFQTMCLHKRLGSRTYREECLQLKNKRHNNLKKCEQMI